MELRHLRYFVTTAEEGHVGRAAARLFISQPSLSQQLRVLERDVGVRLFDRHPRGMSLTAAGDVLLDHARATLACAQAARDAVGRQRHTVTIGMYDSALAEYTPWVMARLRGLLPEFRVTTRALRYDELPRALHDGSVDVIFGSSSIADVAGDTFVPAYDDPLVLVVARGSDGADADELNAADVLDRVWTTAAGIAPEFAAPFHLNTHRNGDPPRLLEACGPTWADMLPVIAYEGAVLATRASFRGVNTAATRGVPLADVAPVAGGAILPPRETGVHAAVRVVLGDIAVRTAGVPPAPLGSTTMPVRPPDELALLRGEAAIANA